MARLVLGIDKNNTGTSSIVKEKLVPMPLTIQKAKNANNKLINGSTGIIDLNGVTDIGDHVLFYAYNQNTSINGEVNFSSLRNVSGTYACYMMFNECTNLTSANLSNLEDVSGQYALSQMFRGCLGITSFDLSKLTKVSGNYALGDMFAGCKSLTSANLSNLVFVSGQHGIEEFFWECDNLISADLSKLTTVQAFGLYRFFAKCSKITTINIPSLKLARGQRSLNQFLMWAYACKNISFPALDNDPFGNAKDALSYFAQAVSGCTIHFPKNLNPQTGNTAISSQETYPNFGGTNTILAFDLPSTYHLIGINSQEYERNPKDDTVTALAWRKKDLGTITEPIIDWTSYYTSTLNDPQIGDVIYSNPECTQTLTTIDSIA